MLRVRGTLWGQQRSKHGFADDTADLNSGLEYAATSGKIGLFHFLSIHGFERKISWGCARNVFQENQGLFNGVRASFPEGSYRLEQVFQRGNT